MEHQTHGQSLTVLEACSRREPSAGPMGLSRGNRDFKSVTLAGMPNLDERRRGRDRHFEVLARRAFGPWLRRSCTAIAKIHSEFVAPYRHCYHSSHPRSSLEHATSFESNGRDDLLRIEDDQ